MTWLLCAALAAAPVKSAARDGGVAPKPDVLRTLEEKDARAWDALRDYVNDGGRPMRPPFQWHFKDVIEDTPMPGIQQAQGVKVKLHAMRVKNNLRGVLTEIVDQFMAAGLFVEPIDRQPQMVAETTVTGLDSDRYISYTAIIRPEKDGTCQVVLGEANIGLALAEKTFGNRQRFAPVPSYAEGVVTSSASEGSLQSISFSVKLGEPELRKWYDTEMSKQGYSSTPEGYRKGSELIRLTSKPLPSGERVVLLYRMISQ